LLLSAAVLVNAATATKDAVVLGDAEDYTILAKTGISTVPDSDITGDIAVSPINAAAITGFDLILDKDGAFSTASQLSSTGKAFASDYKSPAPVDLTAAVGDMETAYNVAAGRVADSEELFDGLIGGKTLYTGVYKFTSDILINDDVTFDAQGEADAVFILQTSGSVKQATVTEVKLLNGAQAKNIFWQVAGEVVVNEVAAMQGVLLVKTAVTFITGSSLVGRVLAQTACTLQKATITPPPPPASSGR
jgi:hypothetical protein